MESKHSPRHTRRAERRLKAWQLRLAGHSVSECARICGVAVSQMSEDLRYMYEEYTKQHQAEAQHFARQDLARLDAMLLALWPAVEEGDTKASTVALRILERRAKLLGLDATQKVEVTSTAADPATVRQQLIEALQRQEQ